MQATESQVIIFIYTTTAIILLLVTVIVTLLYFYQRRQLAFQLKLNNLQLDFEKNSLQTQIEVQEETFQHISREIHDNINLSLTLAKLNLNTIDWNDNFKMKESVKSSVSLLSAAITDLSNLSKSINTDLITEMGLIKAVKTELDKIKCLSHLNIDLQIDGDPVFLESKNELIIFRIIQEALNNVIKHSNATEVSLVLHYEKQFLKVEITDNGIGFDKKEVEQQRERGNAGLKNMQTRTQLFGGEFFIDSQLQTGTRILVTIPYNL